MPFFSFQHVNKSFKDQLAYLKELFHYRNNFKPYRELVEKTQTPAVPYLGIMFITLLITFCLCMKIFTHVQWFIDVNPHDCM